MSTKVEDHEMIVADPTAPAPERYRWNGVVEDREAVEAIFNEKMATGMFLAYKSVPEAEKAKVGSPHVQIRDFDAEAEQIILAPALRGGA